MNTQDILPKPITSESEKSLREPLDEYNYCLRCGRKLKTPENKIRGMGKICWEKSHLEQSKRLFDANGNS